MSGSKQEGRRHTKGRKPVMMMTGTSLSTPSTPTTPHTPGNPQASPTPLTPATFRPTLMQFPDVFIDSRYGYMRLATWEDKGDSKVVKKFITDQEEAERLAFRPNLRPTRETLVRGSGEARGEGRGEEARRRPSPFMLKNSEVLPGEGGRSVVEVHVPHYYIAPGKEGGDPPEDPPPLPGPLLSLPLGGTDSDDDQSPTPGTDGLSSLQIRRRNRPRTAPPRNKPRPGAETGGAGGTEGAGGAGTGGAGGPARKKEPGAVSGTGREKRPDSALKVTGTNAEIPVLPPTKSSPPRQTGQVHTPAPGVKADDVRVQIDLSKLESRMESISSAGTVNGSPLVFGEPGRARPYTADQRRTPAGQNRTSLNSPVAVLKPTTSGSSTDKTIPQAVSLENSKNLNTADEKQPQMSNGYIKTPFEEIKPDEHLLPSERSQKADDNQEKNEEPSGPKEEYFILPKEPVIVLPLGVGTSDVDRVQELQRMRALRNLEPARRFSSPPTPRPTTLCFDYYGTSLSHKQVKLAVDRVLEPTPAAKLVSLQFVVRNVILGTKWVTNRWVITVNTPMAASLILGRGLAIGNQSVRCRRYEDVLKEEYNKYLDHKNKNVSHISRST